MAVASNLLEGGAMEETAKCPEGGKYFGTNVILKKHMETKHGESSILEGGEMMLARMVEERDKDKLELFLQEMENLDSFLDEAELLLRSAEAGGGDESSMDGGLADLLQIGDGDLIPMKDIPIIMTTALQVKKEHIVDDEEVKQNHVNGKGFQLKREATLVETESVVQNVVPRMSLRRRNLDNRSVKNESNPRNKNNDSILNWLKTIPLERVHQQEIVQTKAKKTEVDWFNKFGIKIPGPSQIGTLSLKCEICEKEFTRPGKLAKHISRCVNNEKGYFEDYFQIVPKIKEEMKVDKIVGLAKMRDLTCMKCGRQFSSKRTLANHVRGHYNKTRFPCSHCDAHLQSANHLTEHEMIHTGEKPHKCPECGKHFRTNGTLKKHERTHREKKPFPCPKCEKSYCEYKSLADHFKSHTGEKPFSCQLCKKTFRIFSNMRSHQRTVHVDIEERRVFKCELCEFKFLTEQRLKDHHQMVHLKIPLFECKICHLSCADKATLKVHQLNKHQGVKFPCPQCDYQATQKTNLRIHRQAMHDGIIYKCNTCSYTASTTRSISCHKKLKHSSI